MSAASAVGAPRTYVVTGSASGIGAALTEHLRSEGHRVIGVDLHDAEISVDLSTDAGRAELVSQVRDQSGGRIDGVVAVAGLLAPIPATVSVNYFGAIATVDGLRPLFAASDAPRAAVVASLAVIEEFDDELLDALRANDESRARLVVEQIAADPERSANNVVYRTSKRALALWVRSVAPTPAFAGAGIPLNAVAPGVVLTAMNAEYHASEPGRAALDASAPSPLNGPTAKPIAIAQLLAWLVGPTNTNVTGQIVFIDGGAETLRRPERI
jgi:NAD(P)-dependent dehydrogenase (short-subunit alcohol dehydrogenase family)